MTDRPAASPAAADANDPIVAYLEGTLDAAGLDELHARLAADPAARRRFILIATQIGAIRDLSRPAAANSERAGPLSPGERVGWDFAM